jgi:hypothetical protein
MNDAALKAIMKKTDEFAVHVLPISRELPWAVKQANREQDLKACPRGLKQARVVGNGVEWNEITEFACGDTQYEIPRKNGVLIEFTTDKPKNYKGLEHTTVKGKTVQMIVSRGAILAPWGEYAMIEAQREQEREREDAREQRIKDAVKAIGGIDDGSGWYRRYLDKGQRKNGREYVHEGRVTLSIERAEEIIEILAHPAPVARS